MSLPSSFIDRDSVVRKLIKERCKLADKRSDRSRLSELTCKADNTRQQPPMKNERLLSQMFPPRREWCHLGNQRKHLDALSRNEQRLWYTYQRTKANGCSDEWYQKLCAFADSVVKMAFNQVDGVPAPRVSALRKYPDPPKENVIVCRPICSFELPVKIIFSLLNKQLTALFDPYFEDCSYAFRTVKQNQYTLLHLNAVERIRCYRKEHPDTPLYVAECDMKKFYDTINHRVIKRRFCVLLRRAKRDGRLSDGMFKLTMRWFYYYVDCFNFVEHVWQYNKQPSSHPVWRNVADRERYTCKIEWVEKDIPVESAIGRKGHVGIPQGGPLSGLIANVVMHNVDQDVLKAKAEHDILYCRFCDDMILMGSHREQVTQTFEAYNESIKRAQLIPHPNNGMSDGPMKLFWDGKTRGPYEWGEKGKKVYPWITFVGFDVNWKGNLRIRLKSFQRQIKKQNDIAEEIFAQLRRGKRLRYCEHTMRSSLVARLINTSVGRVSQWNYRRNSNKQSWMAAFSILDENPWSVRQLKELDRHRHLVIGRSIKRLQDIECGSHTKISSGTHHTSRFSYYGCPYSYYGQCFVYRYILN